LFLDPREEKSRKKYEDVKNGKNHNHSTKEFCNLPFTKKPTGINDMRKMGTGLMRK
jgi:hypothetical protein